MNVKVDINSETATPIDASEPQKINKPRIDIEETLACHDVGRDNMRKWLVRTKDNAYLQNSDFIHSMQFWLGTELTSQVHEDLSNYGAKVSTDLETHAAENDLRFNNPRIDPYNGIGERIDKVVHHPSYTAAGDIIYGSDVVSRLVKTGGLREGMGFYYLSCHGGEAGHTCPVICNFETARLLRKLDDFPKRNEYIAKLESPSYTHNYTSSQFLTEVQGGSDVGANGTRAWLGDDGVWRIRGEKWFCSNANAELMVITARFSEARKGTKGLSAFLVPSTKPDGTRNDFTFRRLKEKMGTKALASAEIDFRDAYAIPLGPVENGFNRMMEEVVHYSRIALAVSVLGMTNRGYQQARAYADTRQAFGETIINYPLVQENLANIKTNITVCLAGTFALIDLQDKIELGHEKRPEYKTFSRLMTNIGKSIISRRGVDDLHHCIDTMAGNGAIETTSSLPRLFRDTVIQENWEGTHNTLYSQVLRDFARFKHEEAYINVIENIIQEFTDAPSTDLAPAKKSFARLKNDLDDLHAASAPLKTLKIKNIIETMADVFYYLCTLKEAYDQIEKGQESTKLSAAMWYAQVNLSDEKTNWDDEKLALMAKVVSA